MVFYDIEKIEDNGEIIIVKPDIKNIDTAIMISEVFKENDENSIYRVHELDTENERINNIKIVI